MNRISKSPASYDIKKLRWFNAKYIKNLDNETCVLFTHKRAILGYLLKHCKYDYNLDENLIVLYKDQVIYDDNNDLYDIYEIEKKDNKIINIERK